MKTHSNQENQHETLNGIMELIPTGILLLDGAGTVVTINRAACRLLGVSKQNVLEGSTRSSSIIFPWLKELLAEESRTEDRIHEVSLTGDRTAWVQIEHHPTVGMVITLTDISRLKKDERLRDEFLQSVSHDLRSPLTTISGYAGLLARVGPVNEQQQEFLRRINRSVNAITSLVEHLLASSSRASSQKNRWESVSLEAVVDLVAEAYQPRMGDRKISMEVKREDGLPEMQGDRMRLHQMVDNLIGNAIKYLPEGGSIRVNLAKAKGQIILRIADDGLGIPEEDLPHIFDRFYRASNVPPDSVGTGLGLAIVKSVVEEHGGQIQFDSQAGKGSVFTVRLPIAPCK